MKINKIYLICGLAIILNGCGNADDKAKKLGFSSTKQMEALQKEGYKDYQAFLEKHPFTVASDSTKFAGGELGKSGYLFGEKPSKERSTFVSSKNVFYSGVYKEESHPIYNIEYSCKSSSGGASIDGVSCSSAPSELVSKVGGAKAVCSLNPSYPYAYIYKNAYWMFDHISGQMITLGITTEPKYLSDEGGEFNMENCLKVANEVEKIKEEKRKAEREMQMQHSSCGVLIRENKAYILDIFKLYTGKLSSTEVAIKARNKYVCFAGVTTSRTEMGSYTLVEFEKGLASCKQTVDGDRLKSAELQRRGYKVVGKFVEVYGNGVELENCKFENL